MPAPEIERKVVVKQVVVTQVGRQGESWIPAETEMRASEIASGRLALGEGCGQGVNKMGDYTHTHKM